MRALGASLNQVRGMLATQAASVTALAMVVGTAVGVAMSLVLVKLLAVIFVLPIERTVLGSWGALLLLAGTAAGSALAIAGASGALARSHLASVLRESDGSAPRSPATGLAALEGLVNSASAGGLTVDLHVERPNTPLPVTVDLAAYRIVQEALTNVIKHAGPVAVSVRVIQHGPHLEIEVRNAPGRTATPAPASGSGHGLLGMRERAAALGGTLEAGPLTDGGFRVHALLPAPVEG